MKAALVTGGASGLGRATVERLVADGFVVTLVDRDADRAARVAKETGAHFQVADVTDPSGMAEVVARVAVAAPLRVLVCCAGVGWAMRTVQRTGVPHDLDVFRQVIEVNLIGSFNTLRLAAAAMARNEADEGERGVVVLTASVAAFDGQVGQVAYAASKAGIAGLTLPAARDLAPIGVRVVTIAPGLFDTPLLGLLGADARAALEAQIPFPSRLGRPDEFANLVGSVVANRYLNGEVIRLDGAVRLPQR